MDKNLEMNVYIDLFAKFLKAWVDEDRQTAGSVGKCIKDRLQILCDAIDRKEESLGNKKPMKKRQPDKVFVKPTVEQIAEYCKERHNGINAQDFYDYYESCGWVVGRCAKRMKDWQSAVRYWETSRKRDSKDARQTELDFQVKETNDLRKKYGL